MKVKIITNTVVNGVAFNAGETVEVSESDCRLLVAMGRATVPGAPAPSIEETTDSRTMAALNAAQAREGRQARK
jgi:L-aminopeptidase/D-esterase-like protein